MSFDLSATNRHCDHLCVLERYQINPFDFRTLQFYGKSGVNMRAPINGSTMLRLYFKGTLVAPTDPIFGYEVLPDPARIQEENYPFLLVRFLQPVRMLSSLVEITYFTREGFCLKCGATGRMTDWAVSPSGSLHHIQGVRKLGQQSLKYVLTSKNPFNPALICPIRSYLGQKQNQSISDQDISSAVSSILATYQSIQQAQKTVQTLDPNEMIRDVTSVVTTQDPTDPTKLSVSIQLLAYGSNETIPLTLALQSS